MKKITYLLSFHFFLLGSINAQFVFGDDTAESERSVIQPPLTNAAPAFTYYQVTTASENILQHSSGSKIIVPPHAFVNGDGEVVAGKVDIQYREFTNPLEIYLSGIPMTTEVNNKKEFFQSAAMVEIRVSQNGAPLFPNPEADIVQIEITSSQMEDDFQLYSLDEATGEWMEEGADNPLWSSDDFAPSRASSAFANQNRVSGFFPSFISRPIEPMLYLPSVSITKLNKDLRVLKYRTHLQFRIETHGSKKSKKEQRRPTNITNSLKLNKQLSELDELKKVTWIYDGNDKKSASKFISKLRKTQVKRKLPQDSIQKYTIEDIVILPNFQQDNYKIEIKCKGITKVFQAFPYFSTNTPKIEQKRNEKFYKKYKVLFQERCENWSQLEKVHEAQMAEYETRMAEYDSLAPLRNLYFKDYQEQILKDFISADQKQSGFTRRVIPAYTFGVLNIDKIMKKLDQRILVKFQSQDAINISYAKLIVFDETNNALLTYFPKQKIRFDRSAKNSLLIILDNEKVAMVPPNIFKKTIAKASKEIQLQITPFDKATLNKKILSDVLASE